jgi:hypothetical protein
MDYETQQIFRMLNLPVGDFGALEKYAIRKDELERENAKLRDAVEYYLHHGEAGPLTVQKAKEALGGDWL